MSGIIMEQPGDRLPVQEASSDQDNQTKEIKICGILSYSDGTLRERKRFKRNCCELQSALRIGATNAKQITIVDKDNVQSAFISHLLQWENEIFIATAHSCFNTSDTYAFETIYGIVQYIYGFFKRVNAWSVICRRLAALVSPNVLSQRQQDNETHYVYDIVRSVEQRWWCVRKSHLYNDEKAQLLSALTSLWTSKVDSFAESSRQRCVLHRIIGDLQRNERLEISQRHPFDETTKVDADNFFKEWVYSRGISLTGDKQLENLMPILKCGLDKVFGCVSVEVITSAVSKLRRLDDRTFWFHFSGHHGTDGIQCNDTTFPLLQNILQAAGYALSNIVVTLDCSYADTLLKNFRFVVDPSSEFSGLTVISSGSSEYRSPINSCFTSLLAMAICSASFTCLRPANNQCQDNCVQQEAECSVCKTFSEKCKEKGTISISKIFCCIKDHFELNRKPTIRRHYAKSQLPVARFSNSDNNYRITFDSPCSCNKCCKLLLKATERNTFSLKKVRKMAFLRLLQLSRTNCLTHCEAIGKAKTLACRLFSYIYSAYDDEEYQKQHSVNNYCNCATFVQELLEYSPSSYQGNLNIRDYNKPNLEFKRVSMLLLSMTFLKQNGPPKERKITNNEQFLMELSNGVLLEVNTEDIPSVG